MNLGGPGDAGGRARAEPGATYGGRRATQAGPQPARPAAGVTGSHEIYR